MPLQVQLLLDEMRGKQSQGVIGSLQAEIVRNGEDCNDVPVFVAGSEPQSAESSAATAVSTVGFHLPKSAPMPLHICERDAAKNIERSQLGMLPNQRGQRNDGS